MNRHLSAALNMSSPTDAERVNMRREKHPQIEETFEEHVHDAMPKFKKHYALGIATHTNDEDDDPRDHRQRGIHNPNFIHSPNDPRPPLSQPIKPRFSVHGTASNASVSSHGDIAPVRKTSRAGSLFKRLAGKKSTTSLLGTEHQQRQQQQSSNSLVPAAGLRRKMSTFIHGGSGSQSNESRGTRSSIFFPSTSNSRRGSATSTMTSGSRSSHPPDTPPITSQQQEQQYDQQRQQRPETREQEQKPPTLSDMPSVSRSPSFFMLDTDLNNLSDITNIISATPKNTESDEVRSTGANKTLKYPKPPLSSHKSTSASDLSHHKAQWTAPESWDIEEDANKLLATKRKAKHHHHYHHPQHPRPPHHKHHSNFSKPIEDKAVVEKEQEPPGKYPQPISTESNDAEGLEIAKPIDESSGIQHSASTQSVSSFSSGATGASGATGKQTSGDQETESTISTVGEDEEVTNLRSIDSEQTDDTSFSKFDEEYDKAEYQLEKYYNDFSDVDLNRRYAIRIFNIDDTFTTLSCTPNTTLQDMMPQLKRKFNVGQGSYQVSLKVGKLSKILRPTAKPILIQRRLLLLNGYLKSDPLHIMGIEDLSFIFSFVFHPVATSHLNYEQEQRLSRGDFVHVDLRNMDLTTPPIILYQHTSDIESLDVSNNANIFLPLDFIESAIKLSSLRMVNIRASKFPANVTDAYKLVSLDLERNFIKKVPDSIFKLSNLTIVNLQCNNLERLPPGFSKLKNLQLLDISSNKFVNYPEVINSCTNLLQIDLSYNKIHSLPVSINQLVKLAKMNLFNNRLTSVGDLSQMKNLRTLNLRCNRVTSIECHAPNLQNLFLTDNRISTFDDDLTRLRTLELQQNPITSMVCGGNYMANMTSLSLNKAKLSSFSAELLSKLPRLEKLELNENNLTQLPPEINKLTRLIYLSVARNKLESIPDEISDLRSLKSLDLHSNNLRMLMNNLEDLELTSLNVSSNLLTGFHGSPAKFFANPSPKLAKSLLFLSVADNNLTDSIWPLVNTFQNLKTLNLSYNNFVEISDLKLQNLTELYLSGNNFTSLPGEAVQHLRSLKVLMLNGNKLLSLPAELSQLSRLSVLDVGSNQLKYNISNYHYDWNWMNNKDLKYLNFSGNKRFEIKSALDPEGKNDLSDLGILKQLRVLGLMDVTLKTSKVPDESVSIRLRTTASMINGMRYGVADTLGQSDSVCSRDVTFERFRGREDECLICLYDGKNENASSGHKISKIIRDIYDKILIRLLEKYGEESDGIKRALRYSFLQLNKEINGMLVSVEDGNTDTGLTSADLLSGSSATVVYLKGKKIYTANIGDTMAVLSKNNGDFVTLTKLHVPAEREEYERIRTSGGYVNNQKLDGVSEVSRAVGFFDLLPHIHASPDVSETVLSYSDEMLIIATHKLWEYLDYETVCDISRENKSQPMSAAEKMKDYAISYGCSDNITILCVSLDKSVNQQSQFTLNREDLISRKNTFEDTVLRRLQPEIAPPTGNVAIVFTDIKNSTFLWELFPDAMRAAIKTHNDIMRRQLRIYGGYEVKTEGDAFMVAFPTPTSALVWCLSVQLKLLEAEWPEEITSIQDGCLITDNSGTKVYLGLSVRMGVHWGCPVPEIDLVTQRMDYLGPVVNKAARVSGVADGGQITLSSDFCSEFKKIMKFHKRVVENQEPLKEVYGEDFIGEVLEREIHMLENVGWVFKDLGEQKLKGLETKEFITIAYPKTLASRHDLATKKQNSSVLNDELLFQLRTVSNRLENILSSINGGLIESETPGNPSIYMTFDKNTKDAVITKSTESDWMSFLDHLVTRVESTVAILQLRQKLQGGLELYTSSDSTMHKSVFELLDEILKIQTDQKQ